MEDNKKRPLNEEELEQVTGGIHKHTNSNGVLEWRCTYCGTGFSTLEEASVHEATCPKKDEDEEGATALIKPIIL